MNAEMRNMNAEMRNMNAEIVMEEKNLIFFFKTFFCSFFLSDMQCAFHLQIGKREIYVEERESLISNIWNMCVEKTGANMFVQVREMIID